MRGGDGDMRGGDGDMRGGDGTGDVGASQVQIIMSVDRDHLPGLVVTINSLIKHTPNPNLISMHVVIAGLGKRAVQDYLSCHEIFLNDQVGMRQVEGGRRERE